MSEGTKPEELSDEEWKEKLDSNQFEVLRCSATEPAFSGIYWDHHEDGIYRCAGCNTPLLKSDNKFESGSGWPSFDTPVTPDAIEEVVDDSHGMKRTEIRCNNCKGHVGHVFPDGPRATTGLRYCTNSASLEFDSKAK